MQISFRVSQIAYKRLDQFVVDLVPNSLVQLRKLALAGQNVEVIETPTLKDASLNHWDAVTYLHDLVQKMLSVGDVIRITPCHVKSIKRKHENQARKFGAQTD